MHPEFKQYIQTIAPGCAKQRAKQHEEAASVASRLLAVVRGVLSLMADVIEDLSPYYCELRPVSRVRHTMEKCRPRTQAIGYHGLV